MDINKLNLFNYHCKSKHDYSLDLLKIIDYSTTNIFVFEQLLFIAMEHNDLPTFEFIYDIICQTEYPWSRILEQLQYCDIDCNFKKFIEIEMELNYNVIKKYSNTKQRIIITDYRDYDLNNITDDDFIHACHTNSYIFTIMLRQLKLDEDHVYDLINKYFNKYGTHSCKNIAMICDKYDVDLYIYNELVVISPRIIYNDIVMEDCMVCMEISNVMTGCKHYVCKSCLIRCNMKCPYCRKNILHYTEDLQKKD